MNKGKEQLLHLFQEFQTKTQDQKSLSGFVKFANVMIFALVVLFAIKIPGSNEQVLNGA